MLAIKALYAWQSYYCIDIESRFSCCELLQAHEVHSLRDFMQKLLVDENNGKVVSISLRGKTVSTSNQYAHMSVIADYLDFLAGQLQTPSTQGSENIKRMAYAPIVEWTSASLKTSYASTVSAGMEANR
ncbi:hypothetical protein [Pseudomonas sp. GL-B-19]|uniref:hypothetical protein n=1 Tax=Pseudomonas sp. GL-B-19 TaxID=2832393 RepID=UPI001CBB5093|nr:hypothetical protein [Pseudomonas sp. GL-B-19]